MKKVCIYAIACLAIVGSSCKKELEKDSVPATGDDAVESNRAVSSFAGLNHNGTNFGALINPPNNYGDPYSFIIDVASEMGLSSIRDKAPVPGTKKVKTLTSGYAVLLNFTTVGSIPIGFRTDISSYKHDLQTTLGSLGAKPAVAVIENEETNASYFNGSPDDYLAELTAAISVMHARGIPVANGGITDVGLPYLVYQDLLSRGLKSQATHYKTNVGIDAHSSFTIDRANFTSVLLKSYATMDLDYVNFHWRFNAPSDSTYLSETIDYLKRVTGKPIINNEIGQWDDNPLTVTSIMQTCQENNMPFVLWYSNCTGKARALQNDDGSLNSSGYAYRDFIGNSTY